MCHKETRTHRPIAPEGQKLIQTVEAVRDSADAAKARAVIAADGMVALLSALGVWLVAYLIWQPVFGARRPGTRGGFLQSAL